MWSVSNTVDLGTGICVTDWIRTPFMQKLLQDRIFVEMWLVEMLTISVSCRPSSQEDDAKRLVRDAIAAGIFNDMGSGSNIDLCVITKGKVDYIRPHDQANLKGVR